MNQQYPDDVSEQLDLFIDPIDLFLHYMHVFVSIFGSAPRPHNVDAIAEFPRAVHLNRAFEEIIGVKAHFIASFIYKRSTLGQLLSALIHKESVSF